MTNKNKGFINSFTLIGVCQTDLLEQKDKKGITNYVVEIKTGEEYPVVLRVHFYSLSDSMKTISFQGHRVKIVGSIQGKIYKKTQGQEVFYNQWLQLRGSRMTMLEDNYKEVETIESSVITEDDLPW